LKPLIILLSAAASANAGISVVSAASYRTGPLAVESIATAFGSNLGSSVQVQDSAGTTRDAVVFYASTSQINFQIPPGTASGPATVINSAGNAAIAVSTVSPGLFSIDGSGGGLAAALIVVAKSDGSQTITPVFQCSAGGCVPLPIDLGGPNDPAVLELFGTGIRGRTSLSAVTSSVGAAIYVGPQPTTPGLDQVNISIPHTAAGAGTIAITLTVDGQTSNAVTVFIPQLTPTQRAKQIVSQMTLEEKIAQLHGIQDASDYRTVPGLPRLGIPALNITNGPAGAANGGPGHQGAATALPAPIALAATWDATLASQYGGIVGAEAKALGNGFVEAPDINLARVPQNGRTFEAFGEDPYLVSQTTVNWIAGMQSQGIIAEAKHFACNNQETNRTTINVNVDERTLREIYLPGFEAAVTQGRVGAVMCAYDMVNGAYSCENNTLLNQILKTEWAFSGFVTSDFGATHSTVASANSGLDLEMPTGIYFTDPLQNAAQNGQVPMAVIDDKLMRRYATMIQFGIFDNPPANQPLPLQQDGVAARQIAEAGMVLLQNNGGLLPLDASKLHSIALIGPYAGSAMTGGGGSSKVTPPYTVTPLAGLQNRAGSAVAVTYNNGTNIPQAATLAQSADVAIVMVGDSESEGSDHSIALSGSQDQLVAAVAAANSKTVVVIKSGSAILMPWVSSVPAILEAWYPGEEDGNAVAAVLFGDANPSGKLPLTFPQSAADAPPGTTLQYPGVNNEENYSEGVFVGYRWYDSQQIAPLFPFGHGLSYTSFAYSNLAVAVNAAAPDGETTVNVSFDITNNGNVAGAEVAQMYLGMPSSAVPQPPKQLKSYAKVSLTAGQSVRVYQTLGARSFAYWDVTTHVWKIAPGTYQILVGSSSRDIRLQTTITQ